MDQATLFSSRAVSTDTDLVTSYVPLPGLGVLPVNAFLIRAGEPVLVDTGLAALRDDFMRALRRLIDPADLRWIWITHADADHVGNPRAVMQHPAEAASAIPAADLQAGLTLWSSIDAPWLAHMSRAQLVDAFRPLREVSPRAILSSHLPPATGINAALFDCLIAAREAPTIVGPDQAALEQAAPSHEPVAY